ncbi:MAG: hypothetical protein L0Z48_04025 [candidate division Zixibacteria bacterium]|nr:hypothetical protein [candidate division Zixibacteria bacterium]MCI0595695.1 hypothetical protein [candidate division Zixibacteria bacterium]
MKKTIYFTLLIMGLPVLVKAEIKKPVAPFALLSLKLEGCASCEGCRTAMRQVVQGEARASRIKLNGMTLNATFDEAAQLPIGRIAKGLEASASHRFTVEKIQLSISGTKVTENNRAYLKIARTGQLFELSGGNIESYEDGSALTVSGTVKNWQAPSPLLEASTIKKAEVH